MVSDFLYEPIFNLIPDLVFIPVDFKTKNRGILNLFKFFLKLRKFPVKHIVDLHNVIRSKVLNFLFKIIDYQVVVLNKGRGEKRNYISKKSNIPLISMHERYAQTFKSLGFNLDLEESNVLPRIKEQDNFLKIGIAPFAKYCGKEYSIDNIKKVVSMFKENLNIKFYFFGYGNTEKSIIDEHFNELENSINCIGKYNFSEELTFISSLNLMVSMDSANGHLAAMFGIPVITLWGVTHFNLGYFPYKMPIDYSLFPNNPIFPELPVSTYGKCSDNRLNNAINTISPESVYHKINQILDDTN